MTDALDRLQQLKNFHKCGDGFEACCPGHDDKKESLSINKGADGRLLLHCHAGCDLDRILEPLGLEKKDLFPENGNGNGQKPDSRIIATYDYRSADGTPSYQVVRYEPKDFRQRRADGTWSIKGLKRIPYNLPELLKAEYIFVVEGEKDVESLRKIGLTATCIAGGAQAHWTADIAQYFSETQHVTIIPDNDKPGEDYAAHAAQALHGRVASIRILRLRGLPEHGDVSDWLVDRDPVAAAEELSRLSEAAEEWKPAKADTTAGSAGVYRNITAEVREWIESQPSGTFSTQQVYSELAIQTATDKATARKALERLKGSLIQSDGDRIGAYRIIVNRLVKMNFAEADIEPLDLWLPFDLHRYADIMPGNQIVVTGQIDAGKTAFLFNTIKRNIEKWTIHYFNSEMGAAEMKKRLLLFGDFPINHPHFNAYERSSDFADAIQTGDYTLNLIDFLEVTDEFYKVAGYLSQIHRALKSAVAIVAIQTKTGTDMPLGGERALEKARLAVSLRRGGKGEANVARILKLKNRRTPHSMIGYERRYKLIAGSEFHYESPEWR